MGAAEGLSASEVMARAVARAQQVAERPRYSYTKTSVQEELDGKGNVKERKEKLYDVVFDAGFSRLHLVRVNGQSLSGAQLRKQEEHEGKDREQMSDFKAGKQKGDGREIYLTAEVAAKYSYRYLDPVMIGGRRTYAIAFQPRNGDLPVKQLVDRLLNHIAGVVYIDCEEFEVSKADVHLQNEVTLWGGLIGSLKKCTFAMERTRLADGVWFNKVINADLEGRKLLESTHIRSRTESAGFQRAVGAR